MGDKEKKSERVGERVCLIVCGKWMWQVSDCGRNRRDEGQTPRKLNARDLQASLRITAGCHVFTTRQRIVVNVDLAEGGWQSKKRVLVRVRERWYRSRWTPELWLTVYKDSSEERAARIGGASILLLADGGGSFTLYGIDPRGHLDSLRHQPHRLFATINRPMATDPSTPNCSSPLHFLISPLIYLHIDYFPFLRVPPSWLNFSGSNYWLGGSRCRTIFAANEYGQALYHLGGMIPNMIRNSIFTSVVIQSRRKLSRQNVQLCKYFWCNHLFDCK